MRNMGSILLAEDEPISSSSLPLPSYFCSHGYSAANGSTESDCSEFVKGWIWKDRSAFSCRFFDGKLKEVLRENDEKASEGT